VQKGIHERLVVYLREHRVATLAVEATGQPHAAAVFYAADDDLGLVFVSDPLSRHGQALLALGTVAGTVQSDRQEWHEITGVQFHGNVRQLAGAERGRGWELYTARFPFLLTDNVVLTGALAKSALWKIEPDWMRLIDNRLGFGHKEDWHRRPQRTATSGV
jgi:uncharacterized protein YhbP (UPF0306 family)